MIALLMLLLMTAYAEPTITSDSRLQLAVPDRFKPMSAADIEKLSPGSKFASVLAVRDGWHDQTLAIFTIDAAASEARSLDDFVRRQQQARADRGERDPDPRRTMLPAGFPAFQFVAPKREGENSL